MLVSLRGAALRRFGVAGILLIGTLLVAEIGLVTYLASGDSPHDLGITQKADSGGRLFIRETIHVGIWTAVIGIATVGVVLLGSCGFWARRLPDRLLTPASRVGLERSFWILILIAVTLAGILRIPRMDHSLWNDEELAVRKYVLGSHQIDPETGDLSFIQVPWSRTFFHSLGGNNHITQSVVSRLAHECWAALTGAVPGDISESALRLGSLLAGLGTVFMLGYWLAREGHPRAGITAAFVLAFNPWHIRYAVEARGYSLLLFFLVLMFFCLSPALKSRAWRYWIGFGIAQALALLSFAGTLFLIVPVNLLILILLWRNRDSFGLRRWLMVGICGASVTAFFLLPTIMYSMGWSESLNESEHLNDWNHLREFWGHLMLGTHWNAGRPDLEFGIGVEDLLNSGWMINAIILIGIPLLALVGTYLAITRCAGARLLILSVAPAIILIAIYRHFSPAPFHIWYAIYAVLWFSIAIGFLGELFLVLPFSSLQRAPRAASWAPVLLFVVAYAWVGHLPRQLTMAYPRHPMRDAVESVRGEAPALGPADGWATVAIGAGAKQLHSYDPRVNTPNTLDDFEALQQQAISTGQHLAVYVIGPEEARQRYPHIFQRLDDPDRFELIRLEKGIEAFWSIRIYESH